MVVDTADLVGAIEVAQRLGVRHVATVHKWKERGLGFPEPVLTLGGQGRAAIHLWYWPDVEQWARATGRLT